MDYYVSITGIIQYGARKRRAPAVHEFLMKIWFVFNYSGKKKNQATPPLTAEHFKPRFNNQLAHRSGLMKDQSQALLSCVRGGKKKHP